LCESNTVDIVPLTHAMGVVWVAPQMVGPMEADVKSRQPKSLVITGHSMGGALAVLLGYYAQQKFTDVTVSVLTFGAPQVYLCNINQRKSK
jgi:predicted lipase